MPRAIRAEVGDSWTFIAIDRDTKLILAHQVGQRDDSTCRRFLKRLNACDHWPLPTINRWPERYTLNVPFTFGSRVDFAQLIKTYASQQEVTRYSPATITGIEKISRSSATRTRIRFALRISSGSI